MIKEETLVAAIKATPHGFAKIMSKGKWKDWDYLRYVSRKIAIAVANGGGRILVNMPPQHGKSLFISKWVPLWYMSNFPEKKIILATYEASFAAQWGRMVRDEIVENSAIDIRVRKDIKAGNFWQNTKGGAMMTAGVGGPVTGKSGDLLIIDDAVKNWDEAKSPTYQQRNIDWFNSTFYTRKQPGSVIIVLMTRWHENDLAGWIVKEHTDEWTHIRLPAIAEEDEESTGRKEGESLCPERFDTSDLSKTRRAVGSQVWAGLYQQRPTALEGGIIKRDWVRFYGECPPSFSEMIQSWDLAFKKTEKGSYVVGQIWGKTGGNFYLVDQIRQRMNFPETKNAIKRFTYMYPEARKKIVEDKANGPAIIDDLKKEIPGMVAYKNNDSKESRLNAVSPFFESGNVYIPNKNLFSWVDDFIEEIVNFPNAVNDDQVDACSQALMSLNKQQYISPSVKVGIAGRQRKEEF